MAMKENSKNVLNYLKAHNGEDLTAADVADALGLANLSGTSNNQWQMLWSIFPVR